MNLAFRLRRSINPYWNGRRGQPLDGKRLLEQIPLKAAAQAEYWAAKTPEQERMAYRKMRGLGFPPVYGEED